MRNRQSLSGPAGWNKKNFQKELGSVLCAIDCSPLGDGASSFASTLHGVHLGALDVVKYEGRGLRGGRRGLCHIREDEVDDFFIVLPLNAPLSISQSNHTAIVEPGACVVLGTLRPFEGLCGAPAYAELVARIPGSLLRRQVAHADDCCARPISTRHGAGRILGSLLETLVEERSNYSGAQADRFGPVLLDTVVSTLLDAPELPDFSAPRQSAHAMVFERARDFIESRLSDPALDPEQVARHCRVSVSYLYAAFAAISSLSVRAFIRETRLQRCREALQNPRLHHQSIMAIAMRWGFDSAPGFTRAYRTRFGKPPREDRAVRLLD